MADQQQEEKVCCLVVWFISRWINHWWGGFVCLLGETMLPRSFYCSLGTVFTCLEEIFPRFLLTESVWKHLCSSWWVSLVWKESSIGPTWLQWQVEVGLSLNLRKRDKHTWWMLQNKCKRARMWMRSGNDRKVVQSSFCTNRASTLVSTFVGAQVVNW